MTDFMLKFSLYITLWTGFMFILALLMGEISGIFALIFAIGLLISGISWILYLQTMIWV